MNTIAPTAARAVAALCFALATIAAASLAACSGVHGGGSAPASVTVATDATQPAIVYDAERAVTYLAYIDDAGDDAHVWLVRVPDGGVAETPVRVTSRAGDAAAHEQAPPQLGIGPAGEVYVVWQNNTHWPGRRFPTSNLRFARSTDGGRTFSPAIDVNDDAGGVPAGHTFHDLFVAADGTIVVSWIDSRVRARIEAESGAAAHAAHGAHDGGGVHDGPVLPGPEIRVARSVDGGRSFGTSVVVATDACPCCRTAMTMAGDGTLYVAWRANEDNIRNIVVARSTDGGASSGAPVAVHDDGWRIDGCPHAGPALAIDAAGTLHVAWYTGREDGPGVYHASSPDGGVNFSAPRAVLDGEWVPPSLAKLAVDAEGTVWLGYEDRLGETAAIRVARVSARGVTTVSGGGPGRAPAFAARTRGGALAWLDDGVIRLQMIGR